MALDEGKAVVAAAAGSTGSTVAAPPDADSGDAKARLFAVARPSLKFMGSDIRKRRIVCRWIDVRGSDIEFDNVVVLEGGRMVSWSGWSGLT